MTSARTSAYLGLCLLAAIWGYNWVVIKVATHDADPFTVSMLRCTLGALCLFVSLVVTRRSLRPTPFVPTLILGLLQTALFTFFQTAAVASGGAGKAAILVYTMPFWTVLLALVLLKERVSRNGWIALTLAAIGLACVLAPIDLTHGLASKALAIAGAIIWAASAVYAKHLRAKHQVDVLALTTWQMAYGAIPLILVWLVVPGKHLALTPSFALAMAYIIIPASAGAWLLWLFILSRLNAGVAGIASLGAPVIGVAAAAIQLREIPGTLELIGMACIMAALVANAIPAQPKRTPVTA